MNNNKLPLHFFCRGPEHKIQKTYIIMELDSQVSVFLFEKGSVDNIKTDNWSSSAWTDVLIIFHF